MNKSFILHESHCEVIEETQAAVKLHCAISAKHPHFVGHFATFPVLPAVSQLQFIERSLQIWKGKEVHICQVKRSKFVDIIKPGSKIELILEQASTLDGCVDWVFRSGERIFSRGRLVYVKL